MSAATFDKVADIIAEICGIDRAAITPQSHAINDLGIDSLDFLDVAFAIDKAFGIKMPLEQWTQEVNEGGVSGDYYVFADHVVPNAVCSAPKGDLEKLRKRERLKEFATYAVGKGALKQFSLAAVRTGFSDAWERRDFAAIVSVGRRLPTEAFAQDERLLYYLDNAEQLAG